MKLSFFNFGGSFIDEKTKIVSLSYNAMFKAVFGNNKYMLSKLVQAILDYFKMDINVMDKELTIVNNELSIKNVMISN